MELSHQYSLLEELIMAPKIDTTFNIPTDFFQNTWNFTPFDQTPDLHFPVTNNPSLLELISPSEFHNYPFLDALTSPEFGSIYDEHDHHHLPPMAIPEEYNVATNLEFLDHMISCSNNNSFDGGSTSFKAESTTTQTDHHTSNAGLYSEKRSKSKKPDGQPSKNLMAERRRRKRLNDRLSMLRSIVPKISKMDRTSILGDTIDYMRELLDKIHKLRDEGVDQINLRPHDTQLRNPPKFDVERRNGDTGVDVCCTANPGLLLSTINTLDAIGLDIQQCVISCFNDFSLHASCYEAPEQRSIITSEDVKQALFRNAGYGGRCL